MSLVSNEAFSQCVKTDLKVSYCLLVSNTNSFFIGARSLFIQYLKQNIQKELVLDIAVIAQFIYQNTTATCHGLNPSLLQFPSLFWLNIFSTCHWLTDRHQCSSALLPLCVFDGKEESASSLASDSALPFFNLNMQLKNI